MGRPVKRDVNGTLVFGDYTTTAVGIKCEAYIGSGNETDVFIVKQKGAKSYLVQDKSSGTQIAAKLVRDRKSTRLNSSHVNPSRMPSCA